MLNMVRTLQGQSERTANQAYAKNNQFIQEMTADMQKNKL
jgi:hypothetical protein